MNTSVRYELQDLEKLLSSGHLREVSIEQQFSAEIDRIKKSIIHEVFTFEDERHLERYIQYHQQGIIRMLDTNFPVPGVSQSTIASQDLEELLTFIERHFNKYFDQDAKAPDAYLNAVRKTTRINTKRIFKELSEQNADQRLIEVVLQALSKINDRTPKVHVTYRKVIYAKEVQKELIQLVELKTRQNPINNELIKLIYYLNYNSTKSLVYHAHLVNQIVTTSDTSVEKIEKLSLLLKQINQAQVKPGIAYNPHAASIKDQANSYITEEIEYLERVAVLNSDVVEAKDVRSSSYKLKMELSVSQLSYLIKIFVTSSIIQNTSVNELLRFLSKIIVTKKSEGVSYDSLRAKYYNIETSTRLAVREMLTTLILLIDKDR
jgi:hypothetical protein